MKILWANLYCLLDTSSGASLSVRQILKSLAVAGHEIEVLGATTFDSDKGKSLLGPYADKIDAIKPTEAIDVIDGPITHRLIKTEKDHSSELTQKEVRTWFSHYMHKLENFAPDIVFFYGGGAGHFIPAEARANGIPAVAYLVNGTFYDHRWMRDVAGFVTDTKATRDLYRDRLGIDPFPAGKFIEPERIAKRKNPKRLLYVNPSLAKGASILVMLAHRLAEIAPEIEIEVVESRGDWPAVLAAVNETLGRNPKEQPPNIKITANTTDMASVFARAKLLLVPSLWWESGARVIAEAQLNGVPVAGTNRGGTPELIGPGGFVFDLPEACYEKPYTRVPKPAFIEPIANKIKEIMSSRKEHEKYSGRALANAKTLHNSKTNAHSIAEYFASLTKDHALREKRDFVSPAHRSTYEVPVKTGPDEQGRALFIDCGGYDGCSALKFLHYNPNFEVITFEPNPIFHDYYTDIPTALVKAGIAGETGSRTFLVDDSDGDGSSYVKDKKIDFYNRVSNSAARRVEWPVVDIAEVVRLAKEQFDTIVLKLDIEGSEYEVLRRLLDTDLLSNIDRLYIEWHWKKMGMTHDVHKAVETAVQSQVPIGHWDALDYSVHARNSPPPKRTYALGKVKKEKGGPSDLFCKINTLYKKVL